MLFLIFTDYFTKIMLNNEQNLLKSYHLLIEEQKQLINTISGLVNRFSLYRILLSVVELAVFVALLSTGNTFFGLMLLVPVAIFIIVVRKQAVQEEQLNFEKKRLKIFENEVTVFEGNPNYYDNGVGFERENHPYAPDLDIFGRSSLFELINRCKTNLANKLLALHLSEPLAQEQIMERQEAVREVGEHISETFSFRANLLEINPLDIQNIKTKLGDQLHEQVAFAANPLLKFYVKVVPTIVLILLLVALIFGGKMWLVFGLIIFFHAVLTYAFNKQINRVYYGFSGSANVISQYAKAIGWMEEREWKSRYIRLFLDLKNKTGAEIRALSEIITAFDARLNFLLYAILNFFLLWDLRCCIKLYHWEKNASAIVAKGLDNIGYFEELISFSTLYHNFPNWNFPVIKDSFALRAVALGHPLINTGKRVDNDFAFPDLPTVDIITGSNMAGKSTFLRTVGVNMVLAYAGAPVCAKSMEVSVFHLLSYMRIKDNLIESTSTFKAELNRLKMILQQVAERKNTLVLIDEMLRGTNSKDKFDGSKAFIEEMMERRIPMLFATHDLLLSGLEQSHPGQIRNFHFDIRLEGEEMAFDYQLKSGPCTKFNATVLLRQIGLNLS